MTIIRTIVISIFLILISNTAYADNVYERVMKSGTLRCSYYIYPPETIIDANTGELSGWAYEIVEELGKALNLKIEWVEEITMDTIYEGVNSNRFDALCSTLWDSPERSKHILFTQTVAYPTYYPIVRAEDDRFDKNVEHINSADVKVAVIEGEYGGIVAQELFPKATLHNLPRLTAYSNIFQDVVTKKADVIFAVPATAQGFLNNNPGKLKMLEKEVVVMPASVLMLKTDEIKLKNLFDSTLRHLLLRGKVNKILEKYHPNDNKTNYYAKRPYTSSIH